MTTLKIITKNNSNNKCSQIKIFLLKIIIIFTFSVNKKKHRINNIQI